jgi:hypothetical protein
MQGGTAYGQCPVSQCADPRWVVLTIFLVLKPEYSPI